MDDTFQNLTSDGDVTNFLNYDTLQIPTPTDNLILAAIPTNNTTTGAPLPCLNMTDSSGNFANPIAGASFQLYGTATGIEIDSGGIAVTANGAILSGCKLVGASVIQYGAGSTQTINCVGVIINADQGGTIGSGGFNCTGTCQFNSGFTGKVTDDGSAVWGAVTISGTVAAPAMTGENATTFSATVTCPSINMPNATFGAISQTGAGVNLIVGTLNSAVTWTSVTSIGSIGMNCVASVSQSGNTVFYVLTGSGGTVSLSLPVAATADQLIFGQTVNGISGDQHVAAADLVISPTPTGTTTGTYELPNNVASNTLAEPLIKKDATFGPRGSFTGTLASGGGKIWPLGRFRTTFKR